MSMASRVRSWVGSVFRRRKLADELAEEMHFHVSARAADLEAGGMAPAEAQRRAQAEIGSTARPVEQYREAIGLRLLDETVGDVRYGLRGLWRNKGFAAIAILSLSLGIGATTAMFSIVYAVLLDIYPYADSQRTVNPIVHDPAVPDDWNWFVLNRSQYAEYKSARSFEDVFGQASMGVQMDENDVQEQLHVVLLTANAAGFNRVGPLLGRGLQASDGDFGDTPPNVVVLGYKFWKTHYLADKGVIGRDFKAGSKLFRIVGVMPERYTLGGADVYMPMSQYTFPQPYLIAFAKLKPGVTAKQASDEVDPMLHLFAKQDPRMYPENFHARLQPLLDGFTTRSKVLKNFSMLYLAVGSLLLIGCANCSLLLMARGTTRKHEFALRTAVGASQLRIVRQMLVECLTIAFLGSAIGVVLAYVLARLPLQLANDLFPSEAVIRINLPILLFSVGLAVVAGLLFGLLPALKFSRPEISQVLQANARRTVASGGRRPLQVLIGVQLALTLVLLTVSGAAISGFVHLMRLPLGYQPRGVAAISVGYKKDVAKTWQERLAKVAAYRHQMEGVRGVTAVTTADDLPPSGNGTQPFEVVGNAAMHETLARQTDVGPEYFRTLGIPLLQGRVWNAAEAGQGLPLAVVNEAFVRKFSPDRSVLDRTLRFPKLELTKTPEAETVSPAWQKPEVQVVGVVADAVNDGLDKPVMPTIYVNDTAALWPGSLFLIRTADDPKLFTRTLAHAIRQLDAGSYVTPLPYSLEEMVQREPAYRTQRLLAVLLAIFAGLAFALSLVGLYSVVAYVVAQRTAEFGIRLALGAQRMQILLLVLRGNIPVVLGGTCAGLVLSLALRTRFQHWSEGSSQSVWFLFTAVTLLVVAALLATWYPAFRASRVQPSTALRTE